MTPDEYDEAPWPHRMYHITVREASIEPYYRGIRRKPVHGYVCPPFAARRGDGGGWLLDHMPTGAGLSGHGRLKDAKAAARALVRHTGGTEDWDFAEAEDCPPEAREALPKVRRIG